MDKHSTFFHVICLVVLFSTLGFCHGQGQEKDSSEENPGRGSEQGKGISRATKIPVEPPMATMIPMDQQNPSMMPIGQVKPTAGPEEPIIPTVDPVRPKPEPTKVLEDPPKSSIIPDEPEEEKSPTKEPVKPEQESSVLLVKPSIPVEVPLSDVQPIKDIKSTHTDSPPPPSDRTSGEEVDIIPSKVLQSEAMAEESKEVVHIEPSPTEVLEVSKAYSKDVIPVKEPMASSADDVPPSSSAAIEDPDKSPHKTDVYFQASATIKLIEEPTSATPAIIEDHISATPGLEDISQITEPSKVKIESTTKMAETLPSLIYPDKSIPAMLSSVKVEIPISSSINLAPSASLVPDIGDQSAAQTVDPTPSGLSPSVDILDGVSSPVQSGVSSPIMDVLPGVSLDEGVSSTVDYVGGVMTGYPDIMPSATGELYNNITVCVKTNAHLIPIFCGPPGGRVPKIHIADYVNGSSIHASIYIIDHVNFWTPSPRGGAQKIQN